MNIKNNRSRFVATASVFAALHVVLDAIAGPFRRGAIYVEPLEGMILGPYVGLITAVIGATISRAFIGASPLSFVYGITAEAVGVVAAGMLVRGRWKIPLAIYVFMLYAYFIHPFGRMIPLWTMLDCIVGMFLVYPTAMLGKNILADKTDAKFPIAILLVSFVATVADSLTRVFLLVPVELYKLEFLTFDSLLAIFITGAAGSYIEDTIVCVVALLASVPVILSLKKLRIARFPFS